MNNLYTQEKYIISFRKVNFIDFDANFIYVTYTINYKISTFYLLQLLSFTQASFSNLRQLILPTYPL